MNYIELMNNFWQKDIEHAFSDKETALYFYLLKTCNSIGWKNPFGLSNALTMSKFRWGKQVFNSAKLKLRKAQLIDYNQGCGRGNVYQYEIKGVETDTLSRTLSNTFSDTFSGQKAEASLNININKTKLKNNNNKEKRVGFDIPSVEEISRYCAKRANGINARAFFDYYQAKGWSVGKSEMKDWRAAIHTWERNAKKENRNGRTITASTKRDDEAARRKTEIVNRAIRAVAECNHEG